jgi:hypothetical protein
VVLLADAAAEVEGVDEFFDEADDHCNHGEFRSFFLDR